MVVFVLLLTYISTDAARLLYYWHLSHIRPSRYAQQTIKCSGYKNTNPPLVNSLRISTCLGVICWLFNTLRPRQNGRHFTDDIFKCIFLNEDMWISINISLKFVPKDQINDNPALVQIMAWLRPGDKPLSEPVMVSLLTPMYVTQPQWVNTLGPDKMAESLQMTHTKAFLINVWIQIKI